MKLIYLTAIKYPSPTASAHQAKSMSRAFQKCLSQRFVLLVDRVNGLRQKNNKQFSENLNYYEINCPFFKLRTIYYLYRFFIGKIPFLDKETVIYTKDPQLIFVANLFQKKYGYKTCFELHVPWKSKIDFIVNKTDYFVVLNDYLKKLLIEKYKIRKRNIFVFPDAVDLSRFDIAKTKEECRKALDLPQNKKLVGYVGRYKTNGKEKGIKGILRIIPYFQNDVLFCFIGGEPAGLKEYQNIAAEKKITEKCIFVPFQPFEKLPLYMKAMDLFLLPYPRAEHYEYFMSPLKLFQYMASKRPIVASDLPSLRDVLSPQNSLLVDLDNKKDLVGAIKRVLLDEQLGKKLAKQAFLAVQNYTWDKRAAQIVNFLEENLKSNNENSFT